MRVACSTLPCACGAASTHVLRVLCSRSELTGMERAASLEVLNMGFGGEKTYKCEISTCQ